MFTKANSEQMSYNANTAMNFYVYSLQSEMSDVSTFLQKLCYADHSFQLLTIKNLKDTDKVVLSYNVTEMLKRHVEPYECIFIFNKERSKSMYAFGSSFSSDGSQYIYQLKESLRDYWFNQEPDKFGTWIAYQDEHHSILMKTLRVNDLYVCTTIDLNNFDLIKYANSDYASLSYGFFNSEKLLTDITFYSGKAISIADLTNTKRIPIFSNYYIKTSPIKDTDISIYCVFSSNYMGSFARISVIVFILLAFITCAIIISIFYSFNNILLYPLDQINAATGHLEQNDSTPFLTNKDSNILEYQNINNALANLIDQKIALNNEKQQESFEKDHARLQYYYLQTRSHFFLNCLKSLYNMLEYGENQKMQRMIIAFSNHLRYVFNDNLKLVTLESELTEVNDYYNIIMLDRNSPVIINRQVDTQLYKYQVPSLLIQTFLENTVKYSKQSDNLLIFNIKISLATLEDVPVMQIHLSDNGIGYTPEILERLNSPKNDLFAKKHVGISNLKHRIELIYKTNYQFAFYNSPSGGACALIYLPLLEALKE
jgi:sensor histidine kinase YesM